LKCFDKDNSRFVRLFRERSLGCKLLSTANRLPPSSSGCELLVAADGTGPLADAELRFGRIFPSRIEEGWNHELSFVPLGWGFFYWFHLIEQSILEAVKG